MNEFINPAIVSVSQVANGITYPLDRAVDLQAGLVGIFSRYLGCLQSERRFETEALVVTGHSGSGKTKEIGDLLHRFHMSETLLPSGQAARFVEVLLDSKGGWKDLGKVTLEAMGYPITDKTRKTQTEIWRLVGAQAKMQGIVGIHYDEAQHIFSGKSENEQATILDSFKTLVKSHDCPLILILSGVPELSGYVQNLDQLQRKGIYRNFKDIDFSRDDKSIHEIVGSYAIKFDLEVAAELQTADFLHRLASAGAFRWGMVFYITTCAIEVAISAGDRVLTKEHFNEMWVSKTEMHPIATPFTHNDYETMFRREKRFLVSR
jgi:hypothetical protein